MTLSSKRRAELRAEAHHLSATVHVGHSGITPALVQSLGDALRTHELVKVRLGKQANLSVRDSAGDLAKATRSDVVQVLGKTATLYKENPELKKKRAQESTVQRSAFPGKRKSAAPASSRPRSDSRFRWNDSGAKEVDSGKKVKDLRKSPFKVRPKR